MPDSRLQWAEDDVLRAVITGASGVLGRRIAEKIASKNINLVLVGRDKARLLSTCSKVKKSDGAVQIAPFVADLSSDAGVLSVVEFCSLVGGVDILVNAAGIQGPIGNSWEISSFEFDRTVALNFMVPAALCRALIPSMVAKGSGWIVNVSGGGATAARPNFSAYGAAKTALVRFGETLAAESKDVGIRVNSIAPGAFKSPMTEAVLNSGGMAGEREETIARQLVAKPNDVAEKAADLVAYLVAGAGRNITGRLISAVWDDWATLHTMPDLGDLYTLRRQIPA